MKLNSRQCVLATSLFLACTTLYADNYSNMSTASPQQAELNQAQEDVARPSNYIDVVDQKLMSGVGNILSAPGEIPKDIILAVNDANMNVFLGSIAGLMNGMMNMVARLGVGVTDLVTAPIPTQPMVKPAFVWEKFSTPTTYGPFLKSQPVK
jgi:putative exosortase-associated protein (TIGR04073 family)